MERIVEVWAENLDEEMSNIRKAIYEYPYVSMDTEFPGVVAKPLGNFATTSNFHFHSLRINTKILKLIQLGITLGDADGKMPQICTWQFNFEFDLANDMYSQNSIDLLLNANLNFRKHKEEGINPDIFGRALLTSGLVMNDSIYWISFHSSYDYAYLIKVLTGAALPESETDFCKLLEALFPNFYDIKYMLRNTTMTKKGLQEIADNMKVDRIGIQHQAGSDSYVTLGIFYAVRDSLLEGLQDTGIVMNKLYGLELQTDKIV